MANYNWEKMLQNVREREQASIPTYLRILNEQGAGAREAAKSGLAQRGLLGSAYGQSALASQQASQTRNTQNYLNQLLQQQAARELGTSQFLAQLDEAEKARQLQKEMAEKQLAWQKQQFEESKPKWYDYLLQGLGTVGSVVSPLLKK